MERDLSDFFIIGREQGMEDIRDQKPKKISWYRKKDYLGLWARGESTQESKGRMEMREA